MTNGRRQSVTTLAWRRRLWVATATATTNGRCGHRRSTSLVLAKAVAKASSTHDGDDHFSDHCDGDRARSANANAHLCSRSQSFETSTVHESFGPLRFASLFASLIYALASGTFPLAGYTYTFFVDGISIGFPPNPQNGKQAVVASWTPPQHGALFPHRHGHGRIAKQCDLTRRSVFLATGTVVNSPCSTNTIVPRIVSGADQGDATGAQGFVKQIQFFDNGVAIGSPDLTLPYSLIFTPPGAAGTAHSITAQATGQRPEWHLAAYGERADHASAVTPINPILPAATCVISSPINNASDPRRGSIPVTVTVDAHSSSGSITKVELYLDGALFGTNTTFPYTYSWTPNGGRDPTTSWRSLTMTKTTSSRPPPVPASLPRRRRPS